MSSLSLFSLYSCLLQVRYSEPVLNSIIHYFEHCKGAKQLEKICLEFIVQDQVSPGVYIFASNYGGRKSKSETDDKGNTDEVKFFQRTCSILSTIQIIEITVQMNIYLLTKAGPHFYPAFYIRFLTV